MGKIVIFTFLGMLLLVHGSLSDTFDDFGEIESLDVEEEEIQFLELPSWSSQHGSKVLVNVDSFGTVGDGVSDDTKVICGYYSGYLLSNSTNSHIFPNLCNNIIYSEILESPLSIGEFCLFSNEYNAFINAWTQACSTSKAVLLVPPGRTYLVNATRFKGPCATKLIVQIDGTIIAPDEPKNWDPKNTRNWLLFSNLTGATFQGSGVIDGSGKKWWAASCKKNKTNPCVGAPTAFTIDQSSSIKVNGLTFKNSQQMHFVISRCESVRIYSVVVSAPEDSPNTDGIHLTGSTNVVIQNSKIGTGDDCISIVNGSSNIKMKNMYCGPGHGISIGSLGKDNSTGIVSKVVVDTAFLRGTTNGLRIKTWQGGSGYVKGIRYQNVKMDDVANPIIIDQFYCDSPKSCQNQTSAVEISQIMYQNISGSSKSAEAMKFACSDTVPCNNIILNNINLLRLDGKTAQTYCNSVTGINYGQVQPSADCLTSSDKSFIEETEVNDVEHFTHTEL